MQVEIVTIGDELLLGFTIDTNAAHIARTLAPLGVSITRRSTVGDVESDIVGAIEDALSRADGVITTGGLGPTSDDRSRSAVATLFGRPLTLHEPTLAAIRDRWKRRGLGELPATNLNQAMLPIGATLLENRHGSAPGIWLENAHGKWVAMLPGVPREMRGMLADALIPRLQAGLDNMHGVVASRTLRTSGVAESRIADLVGGLTMPPLVDLAYLPSWEGVDLRLTVRHVPKAEAAERLTAGAAQLRQPLGDVVYGEEGEDLAALIVSALKGTGGTIGVAESCTGGMLGMRLTASAGASHVMLGGVIAYEDGVKIAILGVPEATMSEFGAVSEETAREMAAGARRVTGAAIGVGITGIAGPGGGTPSKPVGTVCIAVDAKGAAESRTAQFVGDRTEVRQRSTQAALMMVRRLIIGGG